MTPTLTAVSREYLYVPNVRAFGDPIDVTTLPVQFAFVAPTATPVDADWHAGGWQPAVTPPVPRILIHGTTAPAGAGLPLVAGHYAVWLRVVGATEQPSRPIGTLIVK